MGNNTRTSIEDFSDTELGEFFLHKERQLIEQLLEKLYGIYLLSFGELKHMPSLKQSGLPYCYGICQSETWLHLHPDLVCAFNKLPFADESVDIVLLPHTLEYSSRPQQILLEVERVLVPNGRILLTGFNPYSLWGLKNSLVKGWMTQVLPRQFLSPYKVRTWLDNLGCLTEDWETFFFRPPSLSHSILLRLQFMEGLGKICWPYLGGGYWLQAKKIASSVTAIPLSRHWKLGLINGLTEPTATRKALLRQDPDKERLL